MSDALIACQPRIDEPSKPHAVLERALVELADRVRAVLPLPGKSVNRQIDDLDVVLLGELEHVFGVHPKLLTSVWLGVRFPRRRTPGGCDSTAGFAD